MNSTPSRFQPSKSVLLVDSFMTHFIKIGGMLVIAAVMGIFIFILMQTAPLFSGASVKPAEAMDVPGTDEIAGVILDEWSEMPATISANGDVQIFPRGDSQSKPASWKLSDHLDNATISSIAVLPKRNRIVAGTTDGRIAVAELDYNPEFGENNERVITATPKLVGSWDTGTKSPIVQAAYYDAGSRKVVAALQRIDDKTQRLTSITLKQKRTLMGSGKVVIDKVDNLTPLVEGTITKIAIGADAELIVAATDDGTVHYLKLDGEKAESVQTFRPFGAGTITHMQFLLADKTLVLCDTSGKLVGYSLLVPAEDAGMQFVHTKTFDTLPGVPTAFAPSERNRSFIIAVGSHATLRYGTTSTTRWEGTLPFSAAHATLSSKFDTIAFASEDRKLHFYDLKDKHPEAGWQAFFGKIWYEGASRPEWTWQSTGGSDSFEPKLSMVPLIFGSLKGTLYAMMFALPLALLAAIYCSQFQHPAYKTIVKPTMEIMASLPSVVLGFLGALWLAPLLENQVPAVLAFLIILPIAAMSFGYTWTRLPAHVRIFCKPGREFIFALPIVLLSLGAAYVSGPVLEGLLFTVPGPDNTQVADFRLWWTAISGSNFEQRNALIVGFMMGFAVIPIIFTIAEDALSNVPNALRSASLALGASRWQTAVRVVLPTASPGIFSGIMIGIGRAVGETMIVLMATGNTPITEWSIFNGMRTLAANIAVELPEAPVGGTLFRSLYMGALLLFCMTFVLNTCAEVLRRHLRNKYKTV